MARPNVFRARCAIRLLGGLDALIRGSGSPSSWMTSERTRCAVVNNTHTCLDVADSPLTRFYISLNVVEAFKRCRFKCA